MDSRSEMKRIETQSPGALIEEIERLRKELAVTDWLLTERERLISAAPFCPTHGKCVPYALEWISKAKNAHERILNLADDLGIPNIASTDCCEADAFRKAVRIVKAITDQTPA